MSLATARPSLTPNHDLVFKTGLWDADAPEFAELVIKTTLPDRTKRFVLTTDLLDRDFDCVLPSGMRYESYLRNPVMLWAHRFDFPPVAKCVGLDLVQGGKVLAG